MKNRIRVVEVEGFENPVAGREISYHEVTDEQLEIAVKMLSSKLKAGTGIVVNGTLREHRVASLSPTPPEPVTQPAAAPFGSTASENEVTTSATPPAFVPASAPSSSDGMALEFLKRASEMLQATTEQVKANTDASRTIISSHAQLTEQSFANHTRIAEVLAESSKREERFARIHHKLALDQLAASTTGPPPKKSIADYAQEVLEVVPAFLNAGIDLATRVQLSRLTVKQAEEAAARGEPEIPPTRLDIGWPPTKTAKA